MERNGITAAGTWIVDYTKIVSLFPDEGACTAVLRESVNNGGAPYNLLVDLCRLGATFPLRAVGCVGRDVDGASILKDCLAHGIDAARLKTVPEASTSFSDVMTASETGIRTSFNHAGANAFLSGEHFDFASDSSRIFYLGTLFFLAALDKRDAKHGTKAAAVLAEARGNGMLTCIDIERTNLAPGVFESDARAALAATSVAVFNVEVAEVVSGVRMRYSAGVELSAVTEAAAKLLEFSSGECIAIRFPTGALALSKSGEVVVEGSVRLPKSHVRGAAGLGHAFTAGFLYEYHESRALADCLKAGHAAAAACLMDVTTSGGVKQLVNCLNLIDQFGQREIGQFQAAA